MAKEKMSNENRIEIPIGRFLLCKDDRNWFIYETYMGKDRHKQPKEQMRMVAGFAWSLSNLERMFVENQYKDIEATTVLQLVKAMKQVFEDTQEIHKTAVAHGLTEMRKIAKQVKEINERQKGKQ